MQHPAQNAPAVCAPDAPHRGAADGGVTPDIGDGGGIEARWASQADGLTRTGSLERNARGRCLVWFLGELPSEGGSRIIYPEVFAVVLEEWMSVWGKKRS